MTLSDAGDCDGVAAGGREASSQSGSGDANAGWIARVQETAARFNESPQVAPEERDRASARLKAIMGRYHQFMGVSELTEDVSGDGSTGAGQG